MCIVLGGHFVLLSYRHVLLNVYCTGWSLYFVIVKTRAAECVLYWVVTLFRYLTDTYC
jgi:hypothetical protein